MFRRYANIVTALGTNHTFKTSFDFVWDVSHQSTYECLCSAVHRRVATTKCAVDAVGFARAICVTLNLDLDL